MNDCFFEINENNVSLTKRKTLCEINPGPILVSRLDREGNLVQVSYNDPSIGIVPQNIVGKNLKHFRLELQNYEKCNYHLNRAFTNAKKEVFQLNAGIRRYHISFIPEQSNSKEVEFVLGIVCDITKEQKVLEQLAFHEDKLKIIQQIAKLGYYEWDIVGNKIFYADQVYKNVGLVPQSIPLSRESVLSITHPQDLAILKERLANPLTSGVSDLEYRAVKPDGSVVWLHTRSYAVLDQDGNIIGKFGTVQDITEKKQAEHRINKAEKDLLFINQVNTRSNYLNRLLVNDYPLEYTSKALSEFGIENQEVYCCFVIQVADSSENQTSTTKCDDDTIGIKQQVLLWLGDKGYEKIWSLNNKIILLVSLTDEDILTNQRQLAFSSQLVHEIKKQFPSFCTIIGISGSSSIPFNIKDVYEKAYRAAIVATSASRSQIVHFDNIGLYEIAFQLIKDNNIVTLADNTIGRLVEYDKTRGANLLLTLKHILEDESLKAVAKKLYIHPNTAIWRKHRIEGLLKMSLDTMETKVTLMLHLKMWELQHKADFI